MGAEKNKGLAYYRYMFCAENCQILAIVDRLKIGVNSLQRCSNDAYLIVIFNSYTMGTSGLPDIYTQSPRATGPRAEGVYIRRTTSAHGITIM